MCVARKRGGGGEHNTVHSYSRQRSTEYSVCQASLVTESSDTVYLSRNVVVDKPVPTWKRGE